LGIRLQLSTSTIPACSPYATRASQFEAGNPKLLETTGDVLLCKTPPLCHLRACTRTSTINLFLLASFPRRPSASQAVPGGATDPTTDNRYANIFLYFRQYEFASLDVVDNEFCRRSRSRPTRSSTWNVLSDGHYPAGKAWAVRVAGAPALCQHCLSLPQPNGEPELQNLNYRA
jgi:hypothetical protein